MRWLKKERSLTAVLMAHAWATRASVGPTNRSVGDDRGGGADGIVVFRQDHQNFSCQRDFLFHFARSQITHFDGNGLQIPIK